MAFWTLDTTIALTSLEKARQQCHIEDTDTSQDDILTRFINEASMRIETLTSRILKSRSITEYHDGRNNNRLITRQFPISVVSELWIDNSSEFTDSEDQLASTDYHIDEENVGIVLASSCSSSFRKGTRNIKIVYTGGYDTIPVDLEGACLWMVEYLYDMRSDERIGTQSKSKNSESVVFHTDVPPFVQTVIDKYTRFEFALATNAVENR